MLFAPSELSLFKLPRRLAGDRAKDDGVLASPSRSKTGASG